jgi:hypothetical protein
LARTYEQDKPDMKISNWDYVHTYVELGTISTYYIPYSKGKFSKPHQSLDYFVLACYQYSTVRVAKKGPPDLSD